MDEQKLLIISIVIAIAGIIFLFFYAEETELKTVERLDGEAPAAEVVMEGVVEKVQEHGNVTFIKLAGQRKEFLDVVVFKADALPLRTGDTVKIQGTVEVYQGKKEIIASSVELK